MNCRTCHHVEIHDNGIWKCGLDEKELDYDFQMVGCDVWKLDELFK